MIDQYYLYSDDVKQEDLEDAVYAGFLSALNDPYTVYYNEEETKEIKESTSGEYSGIGAAMMQNVQTGEITITTVYEDSPAEKAGLLEGDILYQSMTIRLKIRIRLRLYPGLKVKKEQR